MREHTEHTEHTEQAGKAIDGGEVAGFGEPTVVLRGHIGGLTHDVVVIVPRLDDPYSIEVRRADVLDFQAGCPSGRCRFVVRASAPIRERHTADDDRSGVASGARDLEGTPAIRQRSRRPVSRTRSVSSPRELIWSFL